MVAAHQSGQHQGGVNVPLSGRYPSPARMRSAATFEALAEREGHSATLVLSACFPGKISKSGGLEGYIADYKVDYFG
jgi:hypothetical protein